MQQKFSRRNTPPLQFTYRHFSNTPHVIRSVSKRHVWRINNFLQFTPSGRATSFTANRVMIKLWNASAYILIFFCADIRWICYAFVRKESIWIFVEIYVSSLFFSTELFGTSLQISSTFVDGQSVCVAHRCVSQEVAFATSAQYFSSVHVVVWIHKWPSN